MTGWSRAIPATFVDPATTLDGESATLPSRFDSVVAAHDTRLAVEDESGATTYAELDTRSRSLTAALQRVAPDGSPVVIAATHGAPAITAILGAARAGHPYAILDLAAPGEYRALVTTRLEARVVITDHAHREMATALGDGITVLDLDDLPTDADALLPAVPIPDDPLSISFTSGSSGIPKAVVHSHRNVVINGLRFAAVNDIGPDDRVLVSLPLQFTGSATSVYSALLAGATGLYCDLASGGLEPLSDFIHERAPTVVQFTPAQILPLARHLHRRGPVTSVRLANIGGDHLEPAEADETFTTFPVARVLYRYNTSETNWVAGLVAQRGTDSHSGTLPAGWAVPWATVRVVDDTGNEVPDGTPGELWVTGEHLALGYWRDDARTADRFVVDGSARWYRTGDQFTRAPDGLLTHLGRKDRTVKVNGVLVDPARIEHCLSTLPGITDVAVEPFDDDGRTRLAAFLVGRPYPATIVRAHVAASMPRTMVPQRVAMLDALPISARGKTDTAALRTLATAPISESSGASVELMDATETAIAAMFRDLLGAGTVGRDADFFALGGDSLATLELADQFSAEFGVDLELSALLEHPTPAELAAWMRDQKPTHRHLVRVSSGTDDLTPVVFFPGAGGAGIYDLMPMIGSLPERPCYSVIPHAFEHRGRPDRTVPRMAARVVPDLITLDPQCRFVLIGRSSGGFTAIEAAAQLAALGHQPPLVVLLDTNGPRRPRFRRITRNLQLEFATPRRSIWRRAYRVTGVVLNEPVSAYRRMTAGWISRHGEPQRRAFVTVVHRAVGRYSGRPYEGEVLLVQARDRQTDGRQVRWAEVATRSFSVEVVPGRHSNLVRGDYLHTTLAPIAARLAVIDDGREALA